MRVAAGYGIIDCSFTFIGASPPQTHFPINRLKLQRKQPKLQEKNPTKNPPKRYLNLPEPTENEHRLFIIHY